MKRKKKSKLARTIDKTTRHSFWKKYFSWLPPLKKRRKIRRRFQYAFIAFIIIVAIFSYFTNPFVRFSVVIDPYAQIGYQEGQYTINFDQKLVLRDNAFVHQLAWAKTGWHIFNTRFTGGKKTPQTTVDEIIKQIHTLRFDPQEPFLISGDHFSMLYPRSLGIFYHSILDPRTALSSTDWKNRQLIYLKTLAYALDIFSQTNQTTTTIVPIGPKSVALVNVYAPASDTLYSLLFALKHTRTVEDSLILYPYQADSVPEVSLATVEASRELQKKYGDDLKRLLENYIRDFYDQDSGLIRKDVLLSGTKDITKKQSGFYDNVILWRTHQLAQELGIIEYDPEFLASYKQRILDMYWYDSGGYFIEDLSEEAQSEKWYSSDWLIAFQTGFLRPDNPEERYYLQKSVAYIQRNALDQPFALQYHADERKQRLYGVVRWLSPEYGSTTIWSNWGMEYIKLLVLLAQQTGEQEYMTKAKEQLDKYAYNIKRYRGYPEVYSQQGDFYRTFVHQSVRRTGWVVSFEQARALYDWTEENWQVFTL